jgi:hypothetical protein
MNAGWYKIFLTWLIRDALADAIVSHAILSQGCMVLFLISQLFVRLLSNLGG